MTVSVFFQRGEQCHPGSHEHLIRKMKKKELPYLFAVGAASGFSSGFLLHCCPNLQI